MSPVVKYTLARIGLFLVVFLALWPVDINVLLKMMIAVLVSAVLGIFLLRRWRDQVAEQVSGTVRRRRAERENLRSALAGEDTAAPEEDTASRDGPAPQAGEDGSAPQDGPGTDRDGADKPERDGSGPDSPQR